MKICPDCHYPRPNHRSNCPGWTDEDEAIVEEREFECRLKDEPWTLLRECAEAVLVDGPSWSMAEDRKRLRRAIEATKDMEEPE